MESRGEGESQRRGESWFHLEGLKKNLIQDPLYARTEQLVSEKAWWVSQALLWMICPLLGGGRRAKKTKLWALLRFTCVLL